MPRGRRGHDCSPDTSKMGIWVCPDCRQEWEIHGIAGHHVKVRRISRFGKVITRLFG